MSKKSRAKRAAARAHLHRDERIYAVIAHDSGCPATHGRHVACTCGARPPRCLAQHTQEEKP
jgi:hypothetical protein